MKGSIAYINLGLKLMFTVFLKLIGLAVCILLEGVVTSMAAYAILGVFTICLLIIKI